MHMVDWLLVDHKPTLNLVVGSEINILDLDRI